MKMLSMFPRFIVLSLIFLMSTEITAITLCLRNSSGYDMIYKFGKRRDDMPELSLKKGDKISVIDSEGGYISDDISIRGDWGYAPWTELNVAQLKKETVQRIKQLTSDPKVGVSQIEWVIEPTFSGWNIVIKSVTFLK